MRSAAFVLALAGSAVASYAPETTCTTSTTEAPKPSGYAKPSWTTEVVTAITTYCPYATEVTHKGQTYTVTEATTLTITNCPCTVTKPVYTPAPSVVAPAPVAPAPVAPAPATNGTAPAPKPAPYAPAPASQTNAGSKLSVAGAGILAVFGLVAAL